MHSVQANGASIPAIGLGTWQLRDETCRRIVSEALRIGYRHVDTARMYDNEEAVGDGIRASGLGREEVFLTTKVPPDDIGEGDLQRSVEGSLKRLGFPSVDLVLIHWPNERIPLEQSMRALAEVKRRGLARHIGVSNFTVRLLDEAVRLCPEPLVTNQVEYHPSLDQSKVLTACRRHGISLTAYSPIGRGLELNEPVVRKIAAAHGKAPSQVLLRWLVQQDGVIAIPRTSKVERLAENIGVFDFALSAEEMRELAGLASSDGRVVNVSWAPAWD